MTDKKIIRLIEEFKNDCIVVSNCNGEQEYKIEELFKLLIKQIKEQKILNEAIHNKGDKPVDR